MLEAAGLPLSGAQRERKRLMVDCAGPLFRLRAAQPDPRLPPAADQFGTSYELNNGDGVARRRPPSHGILKREARAHERAMRHPRRAVNFATSGWTPCPPKFYSAHHATLLSS